MRVPPDRGNLERVRLDHKARGAYFTPAPVARFLARWAIKSGTNRVLEPSCGDATFLTAAGERLSHLPQLSLFPMEQLVGVEIHGATVQDATRNLAGTGCPARVIHGNFFDVAASPDFDAVLGNPPFVRYQQFHGEDRQKGLRAALAAGVNLNGLASSWAAFVVHASRFLCPNGRLGFVLPAELLTVSYAAPVREYLLKRFARLRLIVFDELLFPDVLEDVVLLMAEGSGGCSHFEVYQVRNAEALPGAAEPAWTPVPSVGDGKWSHALLKSDAWQCYQRLTNCGAMERLKGWGRAYLGAVTGDNGYFTLRDKDIAEYGLSPERDYIPISPPGSRHLRGLEFSESAWRHLRTDGKRCWLFWPRPGRVTAAAQRYITRGERLGVHRAYKCQAREPWYRTPLVETPDILLTYMDLDRPRLTTNTAKIRHLNSLYGIRLKHGRRPLGRELLPIASLNTLTLLGAEVVGRAYGGGMLKLEPTEAEQLPVPSLATIEKVADTLRAIRPQLFVELRQGRLAAVAAIIDRIIFLETGTADEEMIAMLRSAREFLRQRRTSRAKSLAH